MKAITAELHLFGLSVLTGIGLMFVYDCLRIFRMMIRHGTVWVGLEDIGYWAICGLTVFYLLYRENDGRIRWYVVGCIFLTMVIYNRCVSIFFLKWLKKLIGCFKINILR